MEFLYKQKIYIKKTTKASVNDYGEAVLNTSILGPYHVRLEQLKAKDHLAHLDGGILNKAEFIVYFKPSLSIIEDDEILDENQVSIGYVLAVIDALSPDGSTLHHKEAYLSKYRI